MAAALPTTSPFRSTTRPTVAASRNFRTSRPSAMAPSTEPPSESSTRMASDKSRPCTARMKSRALSAVIAPLAAMYVLQAMPQLSAGPCRRSSKRIGSVRSPAFAGKAPTSAARSATTAPEAPRREQRIHPPISAEDKESVPTMERNRFSRVKKKPDSVYRYALRIKAAMELAHQRVEPARLQQPPEPVFFKTARGFASSAKRPLSLTGSALSLGSIGDLELAAKPC